MAAADADFDDLLAALARLEQAADVRLRMALKQGADEVVVHAKQNHDYKDRTGRLTQSIAAEQPRGSFAEGMSVGMVAGGLRVSYAAHVEYGTRAHIIKPRRRKWLRFMQGGQERFAKMVRHPGTRPYRFMQNALDAKLPRVEKLVETAMELALHDAGLE